MVYQYFTLVTSMTVAENLVMSHPNVPLVINWCAEIAGLRQFMQRMPFKVPLEAAAASSLPASAKRTRSSGSFISNENS